MDEKKHGWAAMNRKERIFFLLAVVCAAVTGLLMHFDPVHAFSGWAALPAALTTIFAVCSTWRQCRPYERICLCLLAAAMTAEFCLMPFIFVTPTNWAVPLFRVCMVIIFTAAAVLSWRKNRMEAYLFGAAGIGYMLFCIVKWVHQIIS